jgi:hypothetical protein
LKKWQRPFKLSFDEKAIRGGKTALELFLAETLGIP